ncbi:hypothetical protein CEV33_0008 [Brucella grignonensis]|uniref:Uncharacterized protein n=1 Tax=Brucella grignonensis TaxID=94627 RepID=A0A256FMB3_9HYPH|nr:hypothetical protein CEV33_0008 [Brucella grignonensis]
MNVNIAVDPRFSHVIDRPALLTRFRHPFELIRRTPATLYTTQHVENIF